MLVYPRYTSVANADSIVVIDVSDPAAPVVAGVLPYDFAHGLYARGDNLL